VAILAFLARVDALLPESTASCYDIQPCASPQFVPSLPSEGSKAISHNAGTTGEEVGPNSFVSRILISKFFHIRILRGISC
jgi:hypothetical protein